MSNEINGTIVSKGLYSSFCHVSNYDALFDAGEGCATLLGNSLANVTRIMLGHSHSDHVLGLPSIIGCRDMGRQTSRNPKTREHNKPLDIFYPADNVGIVPLMGYISTQYSNLRYDLMWNPIEPGWKTKIGKDTYIEAFGMQHQKTKSTLGYVVYENRTRLNPKYAGQDIAALKRSGVPENELKDTYRANIFAYCLDSYKIDDPSKITNCEKVVMDCTFLNKKDRTSMTHFTLDEAIDVCSSVGVKIMIAAHLSPRYFNFPHDHPVGPLWVTFVDPATPYTMLSITLPVNGKGL